jgi:hypothetical protein
MKKTRMIQKHAGLFSALLAMAALVAAPCAFAQGTSFTYQGQLDDAGFAAHGAYDIRFSIWDAEVGGSELDATTVPGVPVDGGLFDVELDFGAGVFKGPARWLEIGVQTNGGGGFTTLSPRTEFTSAPFAITALTAAGVPSSSIGSAEVANNSLTANDLGPNSVGTSEVIDNSLLAADLAPDSVGASELAANSVYATDIVDGQVGAAEIGANAVGQSEIAPGGVASSEVLDNSLTANDLAPNSVGASEIASNSVGSAEVIDGSLLGTDMANNTVGSDQLADFINLGSAGVNGEMNIYNASDDGFSLKLLGGETYGGRLWLFSKDGQNGVWMGGGSGDAGKINVYNTNAAARIELFGFGTGGGGSATFDAADGTATVQIDGEGTGSGGEIKLDEEDGTTVVELQANGGGQVSLSDSAGVEVCRLDADTYGGELRLYDDAGETTVLLDSSSGGGGYSTWYQSDGQNGVFIDGHGGNGDGVIYIYDSDGSTRISLDGDSTGGGGEISVHDNDGTETVQIIGAETSTTGAEIALRKADGTTTITLDADFNGDGRITTQELEITGGSDLSEQFDIDAAEPGAVVCIDAVNPGKLVVSSKAYDRTVAGIVSGAGGIKPGMMMGQDGTVADGEHPVALTGRVYCKVDASQGAIEPGDLITTSNMPGHGMKVVEHAQAQGAIIGKAMTPLAEGQGLVLVLVSLQ